MDCRGHPSLDIIPNRESLGYCCVLAENFNFAEIFDFEVDPAWSIIHTAGSRSFPKAATFLSACAFQT
jgi:hypothetical protein